MFGLQLHHNRTLCSRNVIAFRLISQKSDLAGKAKGLLRHELMTCTGKAKFVAGRLGKGRYSSRRVLGRVSLCTKSFLGGGGKLCAWDVLNARIRF